VLVTDFEVEVKLIVVDAVELEIVVVMSVEVTVPEVTVP